jgi:FtsP/CotA-like multicopper oxidase with cupredoxin domain
MALALSALLLGPLTWLWWQSRLPSSYSVMDMGYADYGGGPKVGPHQHAGGATRSVADLTVGTDRAADVHVDLVARRQNFTLASGQPFYGYTLNGTSPGPVIRATQGELVEVRLSNENIPAGITLHWHGVDVPNAEDGVAGVTQDAVAAGRSYTYRFIAKQAGTYWYHSHQVSHEQVKRGLFGAFVVDPKPPAGVRPSHHSDSDQTVVSHVYGGLSTVNGVQGDLSLPLAAGSTTRLRLVNTDNGPVAVWVSGSDYRVLAADGYDVNAPTAVSGRSVLLTAGGRVDLAVTAPASGRAVRVDIGGASAVILGGGPGDRGPVGAQPQQTVDLLSYGSPAPLGFTPESATRHFTYSIGRRPGFLNGRPGIWWSINGHVYPDVPMFVVAEGDVVQMRIANHSGRLHPMHLHGHHAVVLARNGVKATGSPWWVDSLNVESGETYEIAFVADNPGIWMDHCHNLPHAQQGLVAHLMYEGVTEPFRVGGKADNAPE